MAAVVADAVSFVLCYLLLLLLALLLIKRGLTLQTWQYKIYTTIGVRTVSRWVRVRVVVGVENHPNECRDQLRSTKYGTGRYLVSASSVCCDEIEGTGTRKKN